MTQIDRFAELHESEEDALIMLARFVKSAQGAVRYKTAIGSVISGQKGGSTLNKVIPTVAVDNSKTPNLKTQLVQLKKVINKLDEKSIRNILKNLQTSKNIPRNKNHDIIKEMLEEALKNSIQAPVNVATVLAKRATPGKKVRISRVSPKSIAQQGLQKALPGGGTGAQLGKKAVKPFVAPVRLIPGKKGKK